MAIYQGHNEDSSGNLLLSIGNGMTATVETGPTASQAYTKGSYLFFNNRLCKAASSIASGATLTIGGNLTQTSLGAEITSHLRSSDGKEFYFDVKDGQYGYYPSASKTASEFVPFGGTSGIPLLVHDLQMTSVSISNTIVLQPGANGVIEADKLTYSKLTFSPGNFSGINAKGVKGDNTVETISVTPSSLSSINFGNYKHLMIYFNQAYGISNTVSIS